MAIAKRFALHANATSCQLDKNCGFKMQPLLKLFQLSSKTIFCRKNKPFEIIITLKNIY